MTNNGFFFAGRPLSPIPICLLKCSTYFYAAEKTVVNEWEKIIIYPIKGKSLFSVSVVFRPHWCRNSVINILWAVPSKHTVVGCCSDYKRCLTRDRSQVQLSQSSAHSQWNSMSRSPGEPQHVYFHPFLILTSTPPSPQQSQNKTRASFLHANAAVFGIFSQWQEATFDSLFLSKEKPEHAVLKLCLLMKALQLS